MTVSLSEHTMPLSRGEATFEEEANGDHPW